MYICKDRLRFLDLKPLGTLAFLLALPLAPSLWRRHTPTLRGQRFRAAKKQRPIPAYCANDSLAIPVPGSRSRAVKECGP
ncbi:hypothetical protein CC85DRAFT_283868 [Cutaneotrichosporon oleaginosum]|uniref:Uncharacterized protein n=1 Tax=Cutaneotrichosporon oleaginosum TaxID=879819 RepID=A0A0J1B8I8_9TREE|nr:uncharacterized protein CC85DRAFT_283868 [Cutaneotrichosporon oleaginosum]KLT44094.1 hypothetical protein CC85DRAFT_283868 [Cutaneotrichosporon oleaginosum]